MAHERYTGLVLTGDHFAWTSIERKKDVFDVVSSGIVEIPPASPSPEGEQGDASPVNVSQLIKKEIGNSVGKLALGLSSDKILLRIVKLPLVPDDELTGMVQLQVDKFSPFPIEEMVISHEVLEKSADSYLVLVVAVKNDVVDSQGRTVADAGLSISRVDGDILGWWQILNDAGEVSKRGRQISIIMAGTIPDIVVSHDGIPVVFRSLSGQSGASIEEYAEELAQEVAYTLMSLELEHGTAEECTISIWYRDNEPVALSEKLKLVCAGDLHMKPISNLPTESEGLARRMADKGRQLLDLTPLTWRASDEAKAFKKKMLLAGGLALGIWIIGVLSMTGGLLYHRHKLDSMKAELERASLPAKQVTDMKRRFDLIKRYSDRTHSSLECLREVSSLLPEGVDLLSFEYKRAAGQSAVTINGQGSSVGVVYDFKTKLDASKLFIKGTIQGPVDQKGKQVFKIDMKIPGNDE